MISGRTALREKTKAAQTQRPLRTHRQDASTHLCANVLEQVLDVVADEGVLHDLLLVLLEDLLEVLDLVALVGHHQIVHRRDLRVLLIRLHFLLWCLGFSA
jgi:hypothetical protein